MSPSITRFSLFALLIISLLFVSSSSIAQVILGAEDFDGGGVGFSAPGQFNDGSNDHFNSTTGSDISNVSGAYSFEDGTNIFWAAEDVNDTGGNGNNPQPLTLNPISIAGHENIQVCVDVAAGNTSGSYDRTDFLDFFYTTDVASTPVAGLSFRFNGVVGGSTINQTLGQDIDGDGSGIDGPLITPAAATFCFNIPANASTGASVLNIEASVGMNAGNEEIAFDNFIVTGSPLAANQPPSAGMARVSVELPTSGGAECPLLATVNSSFGGPALMAGDVFSVDDVIFISGIGVPVPTTSEVNDDNDPTSALIVNVTDVVVTPATCTTEVSITYTVEDTEGAMSNPRTDTFLVIDNEAPAFTTPAGSLDAAFAKTALTAFSTGDCTDDIDLVALATAAEASANGGPTFLLGALPIATDECAPPVTYNATASLGATSNACLAFVELEVSATDACGNTSTTSFLITYTITGSGAATLPAPPPAIMATTSAGANCLMPFESLAVGDMFAPGTFVMIAGQAVPLPTSAEIMGCVGLNPMFTITALNSAPSADPCVTNLIVDFSFDSDCGTAGPIPYSLSVDLNDDTAPVVVAPANTTITCLDDPTNLMLTGEATATDNCAPGMMAPLIAAGQIFINEFHYDNISTDVGEFIEIAGPAGTNLSGFTLELVNGGNGTVYNTLVLSGIIPNEGAGFGAISFPLPSNGLQNGAPDGIALCGPTGIVEFLSYEGAFVATAGCANGIMSTDVGVSENNNDTPIGTSLQRTGTGTNGGDFAWVGPTTQSPGALNAGQMFSTTGPGGPTGGLVAVNFTDNVIPGACSAESTIQRTWEAIDACGNIGTALQTIMVVDPTPPMFNQATGALDNTITTTQLSGAGFGSCAVQVDVNAILFNINFAILFGQTSFGGIFQLPTASDDCAFVSLQATSVEITNVLGAGPCSASIQVTFTATNDCGRSSTYVTTLTIVDDEAPVIDPGFASAFTVDCDMPFDTATTGQPTFTDNCGTSMTASPALWINEFHYDNTGGDQNEFVEIAGTAGINLAGYSLEFYNGGNGAVYRTTPLSGILPNEGQGGGALSFPLPANGIQNGSPDGIALVDPMGVVIEFISYEGVMTASNGAAVGMMSTDIGVEESDATTLSTQSLQRVGAGDMASSFMFAGPSTASPGFLNTNQVYLSSQTVTVTFAETIVPNAACVNGQTITREWTADDGCGNSTVATQIVEVVDDEAPVYVTFPSDSTIECSSLPGSTNLQAQVVAFADGLPFPVVTDNCSTGLIPTFTDVFTLTGPCPTVSTFERIFDPIDDGCGNILSGRTLTITVIDTLAPLFVGIQSGGDINCEMGSIPALGTVTVIDCDPNTIFTEIDDVQVIGSNGVARIVTRSFTAIDGCGNESTQVETYRLLDLIGPTVVTCPADIGPIVARPDDMATVTFDTPVFEDNCSFSVSSTHVSGQDFPVGITTVTFTAADEGGGFVTCTFQVEVAKALNLTCVDQRISIDTPSDLTRADINFPFPTTTCEACPQGEPLPSLDYLGYFQGHRYYVSAPGDTRSWTEAQRHAVSLGGRLVEVNSPEENLFLQRELPYNDALIGHFTGPNSTTYTGTFSSQIFENFAPGFPTIGTNEFFVLLDASNGTHTNVNHSEKPFIVEFPCVEIEVIDMPSDGLFDQGTNCVIFAAVDQCGNRDTCHYTFGINTFDVTYCGPSGATFDNEEEYFITEVSVDAFAKTFDASSSFLNLRDTIELEEDIPTVFSFSAETSGMEGSSFPAYWRVWVDANRDGDFYDAGEMIHEVFGDASVAGTLELPSALQTESPTRIRIAFSRFTFPEVCGDNPFGDVKDFQLLTNNLTTPRLVISGARGLGQQLLTVFSEEDPQIDSYMMLRGVSMDQLTKLDFWDALYGDGIQHNYNLVDSDPMLSAYYQAVALDDQGFAIRSSNIIYLTMPPRRGTIKVYPNPAFDVIHVELGLPINETTSPTGPTTGGNIDLYDGLGRVIIRQSIPKGVTKVRMALPTLVTGTYILRVSHSDRQPQTLRVMVDQGGGASIPRS